jgi:hypothetical protein
VYKRQGLVYQEDSREVYRITDDDPTSAVATSRWQIQLCRGKWNVRTTAHQQVTATANAFRVQAQLTAECDGELVAAREWDVLVPRTVG